MQIYELIPKVMKDIGAVAKDQENKTQGYKFRGIAEVYNAVHPAMVKHGVFCCPQVLEYESTDRVRKSGSVAIRVTMKVSHKFYAPDGSFVEVITLGDSIDDADKASNKAMSFAMKYAFIELFSIPTADIEDGDSVSPEAGTRSRPVERSTAPISVHGNGKDVAKAITAPADSFITKEQAKTLHMRFRDELRAELKSEADSYLHDWLIMKSFLNEDGDPSALAIPKEMFKVAGMEAMKHAASL